MPNQEAWVPRFNHLVEPTIEIGLDILRGLPSDKRVGRDRFHVFMMSYCALLQLADCLKTSVLANLHGKHSVAVCLIRQSVEALTLVDIGLQEETFSYPLLQAWDDGKKSHGDLRCKLEQHVWPRYGNGLWGETWTEFFGNLARSVQPYAHYTQKLMLWQFHTVESPPLDGPLADKRGFEFYATIGPTTSDEDKGCQITLLQALVIWTLGRLLLEHSKNPNILKYSDHIRDLGTAIGNSSLLDRHHDWSVNLLPVMFPFSGISIRGDARLTETHEDSIRNEQEDS